LNLVFQDELILKKQKYRVLFFSIPSKSCFDNYRINKKGERYMNSALREISDNRSPYDIIRNGVFISNINVSVYGHKLLSKLNVTDRYGFICPLLTYSRYSVCRYFPYHNLNYEKIFVVFFI